MIFNTAILNKSVEVELINKTSNKHTYLRLKNRVSIVISSNIYFTIKDAKKLIKDQKEWIEKRILFKTKDLLNNDEYFFLGQKYMLDSSIKSLDEFYRKKSKEIIPFLLEKYSNEMNLHSSSIKYRKNKNTWGSCNYKNGLNFNILLVKYPIEIVEYVVIHELAHIQHKNHSKQFWNLVKEYCPSYKERIRLFKSFL